MALLDPNTPPIGRQPEPLQITPSARQPWYGSIVEGEPFTRQQLAGCKVRGLDPAMVDRLLVKRQATHREMYWPTGSLPPVFAFECPVVGRMGDKVKVIAPSGDVKAVAPDGWAHRPYRKPKFGGY